MIKINKIEGKSGIEVVFQRELNGEKHIVAKHYYDKEVLDREIKDEIALALGYSIIGY